MRSLTGRRGQWLLGALALAVAQANGGEFTHVVDGVAISLQLDREHLAMRVTGRREPPWPALALASSERLALPEWSVGVVPIGLRTDSGLRELAQRAAALPGVFVSPRLIDPQGGQVLVTADLLVGFHPQTSAALAQDLLAASGPGDLLDRDWSGMAGVYRWRCATADGFEVLARVEGLWSRPEVRFAEPDFVVTGRYLAAPNDPGFGMNWGLHNSGQNGGTANIDVDALEAWDLTRGEGVTVVVFDSGVQLDHPDLGGVIGADFTSTAGDGSPVNMCDVHGTTVAGVVGARRNNGLGTVGVAPGCVLASAKVAVSTVPCDGSFSAQPSWFVNALDWAQTSGARITNSSLGLNLPSSALTQKFADTRAAGMVHFGGAGNDGGTNLSYPASLPAVNAVSAVDRGGLLANFAGGCLNFVASSTSGPGLAFCAPGEDVYTTDQGGVAGYVPLDYVCIDGTSYASPFAAGVGALVASVAPDLAAAEIETILRQSALDLGAAGYDTMYGDGLPKARAAVLAALAAQRRDIAVTGPAFYFGSWTAGDATPPVITWTLSMAGNASVDVPWTASIGGEAGFVSLSAIAGTLSAAQPQAMLSITLDPLQLTAGVHRAVVRVENGLLPGDAHELPITLAIDMAAFTVGDTLAGAIDDESDVDTAAFQAIVGETLLLKLKPTADKLKLRVEVCTAGGALEKAFTFKSSKKAQSKKLKLKVGGLHTVSVRRVSGTPGPYELQTVRKKPPGEAASQSLTVAGKSGGAPALVDLAVLPGAKASFVLSGADVAIAHLAVDLTTPTSSVVGAGVPVWSSSLQLPQRTLGDAGLWRLRIHGLAQGEKLTVVRTLVQPNPGLTTITIQ